MRIAVRALLTFRAPLRPRNREAVLQSTLFKRNLITSNLRPKSFLSV